MKRLTIFHTILLLVFGALAVSGVLIFALAVGNDDANTVGPVGIWGTLDGAAVSAVLQSSAEENPIFKEVAYEEKDLLAYESELTTALANGEGPDLFVLRQDYILKDAGKAVPVPSGNLSESQFQDLFIDAANPYYSPAGALAIPILVDPLVLYWNRDLLASAGFVKPPSTWDELSGMSEALTRKSDSGVILKSSIPFGEARNVTNAKDILSALILQAGGSITAPDASGDLAPALRSGGEALATENALRFYTKFTDPSKSEYSWNRSLPESRKAFAAGDAALYIGFGSEAPLIAQMNPNLAFAAAALPQLKGAEKKVSVARVYALAVSRAARNPDGAFAIAFNMAAYTTNKKLSERLGIPSALRDVLSEPAEGAAGLFNKQAILARSWRDPDPEKTAVIFRDMIERVTSGSYGVSDAVQRADEEMGEVMKKP